MSEGTPAEDSRENLKDGYPQNEGTSGWGKLLGRLNAPVKRLPIRLRLAIGASMITVLVLGSFCLVVGLLAAKELRDNFHRQVTREAISVERLLAVPLSEKNGSGQGSTATGSEGSTTTGSNKKRIATVQSSFATACENITTLTANDDAEIRLVRPNGVVECASSQNADFGVPSAQPKIVNGYYVEASRLKNPPAYVQYGRPIAPVEDRISRIAQLLLLGVVVGTALAFFVGSVVARIALSPITQLTATAREIKDTLQAPRRIDQTQMPDELGELSRTLEGMVGSLERSRVRTEKVLERQRQFVADASHELGTPLTSLLANLEFILVELEGEHSEAGESAYRSAKRLKTLVSDLLFLAREDAGRKSLFEKLDLAETMMEVVSEMKPLSAGHEILLHLSPTPVEGVSGDLHRLALNLVSNAVRHTPVGSQIEIEVGAEGDWATLIVADTGPGIPDAIAPRVFDRFVKGRNQPKGSSGLGLAIVKTIAEAHSGRVRLDQKAGSGARFVVELPVASV